MSATSFDFYVYRYDDLTSEILVSAFDELQKDDVITVVDDELIIGEPLLVVQELLSGPLGAEMVLGFSRFDKKTSFKQRCSAVVLFDYQTRDVGKELKTRSHGLAYLSGGLTVGALLFTAFGLLDGSGNEPMTSILLPCLVALFLLSLGPAQSCARCTTTVASVAAAKKAAAGAKVVTLANIRQCVCVVRECVSP